MLKVGVASAVLPPAVTYVRARWVRPDFQRLFVRSFFFNEPMPVCGSLTRCSIVVPTPAELETIFAVAPPFNEEAAQRMSMLEAAYSANPGPSFYDFVMQQRTVPEKVSDYVKKLTGLWE